MKRKGMSILLVALAVVAGGHGHRHFDERG
jgi:hypothetical protein